MKDQKLFKRGIAELLTLKVLSEEELYTYQIIQKLRRITDNRIEATDGLLYPILRKLSSMGFVSERQEIVKNRIRLYYHLEPSGIEYYRTCREEFYSMWELTTSLLESGTKSESGAESKKEAEEQTEER